MGAPEPLIAAVQSWVADLRAGGPPTDTGLSTAGATEAWNAALDALDPEALDALGHRPGAAWESVAIVTARGAFTAPLEWCAAFLVSGAKVGLKAATTDGSAAPRMLAAAARAGLPLRAIGRAEVLPAALAVVMGSDETVSRLTEARTGPTLGFGHKFSAAWLTGTAMPEDPALPSGWSSDGFAGLAMDLALFDTQGCLSPAITLTPHPVREIADALAPWMDAAQRVWPRGDVSDAVHAEIRTRRALARATTGVVVDGAGWCILGLPPGHLTPAPLPRVAVVCEAGAEALAPWLPHWSTLGADAPLDGVPASVRLCRLGRMQRPPLSRLHDGVDWLAWTRRTTRV